MDLPSVCTSKNLVVMEKLEEKSLFTEVKDKMHSEINPSGIQQSLKEKQQPNSEQQQHEPSLSIKERYEKLLAAKKNVEDIEGFHSPRVRVSRTSFLSPRRTPLLKEESFRRRSEVMKSALIVVDPLPMSSPRKDTATTLPRKSQQHSYDTLKKKLKKVGELQRDIIRREGEIKGYKHKNYKKYESKRLEYVAALEECEAESKEETQDLGNEEMKLQQKECKVPANASHDTLKKRLKKVEQLQRDIIKSKGESNGYKHKNYKKYEAKRLEYVAALEECEAKSTEETSNLGNEEMKLQQEECKLPTSASAEDVSKRKDKIERDEHEKSLDRQFRRLQEIENLKRIYQRLSLERMEAEAAAERIAAALGEGSEVDWSDLDSGSEGEEIEDAWSDVDGETEGQPDPIENERQLLERHSYAALKVTLRELDELLRVHSSCQELKEKKLECEKALRGYSRNSCTF